ncbi:MAG: hypothetical protein JWN44_3515 [Myxococcales bacterium]|nr:hypothetical protein [Myxococcales bacterium]
MLLVCSARAAERPRVVVTAVAPVDADRLAEAMRAYLDEFAVDVVTAAASTDTELRAQLDATKATGADVRAVAAIRVADARAGTVEIALVDRLSGKALIATLARPPRDEDLYRAVALKVQALLRSSLYERHETLATEAPELNRLVAAPVAPARPRRWSLDAGYALVSFPLDGIVEHGVAIDARVALGRLFEVALGAEIVAPAHASRQEVAGVLFAVPITARGGVHGSRGRWQGAVAAVAELLIVSLEASSASAVVRSDRTVAPGFGAELTGQVRLVSALSLFVRGSAIGLVDGPRYLVRSAPIFDVSRLQVGASAGLAVALW